MISIHVLHPSLILRLSPLYQKLDLDKRNRPNPNSKSSPLTRAMNPPTEKKGNDFEQNRASDSTFRDKHQSTPDIKGSVQKTRETLIPLDPSNHYSTSVATILRSNRSIALGAHRAVINLKSSSSLPKIATLYRNIPRILADGRERRACLRHKRLGIDDPARKHSRPPDHRAAAPCEELNRHRAVRKYEPGSFFQEKKESITKVNK